MNLDLAAFRAQYSAFLDHERILLTGHSHQAWPDVAEQGQIQYFRDSARWVDDKWGEVVFAKIERVGRRIRERMGLLPEGGIVFGKSTHELGYRLLSCFSPTSKTRIVTTSCEFHSLRRQLSRLQEEGVEVVWVDANDRQTLAQRLIEAITPGTTLVAFSGVLFEDSFILGEIPSILAKAKEVSAHVLLDLYHAFNVVPIELSALGEEIFIVAGGYKYAQFGEGVCWMTVPKDCELRPVYTGWFAEFGTLSKAAANNHVSYSQGALRFAGATFDPSGIYRAEVVLDHFDKFGLSVNELRNISTRQTQRIIAQIESHSKGRQQPIASDRDPKKRAGFVSIRTPKATEAEQLLRKKHVRVDARRDLLRVGPAPYLTDNEIDRGVETIVNTLAEMTE